MHKLVITYLRGFLIAALFKDDRMVSVSINKKDGGIRYISLDCPNNEIGDFLFEVFQNSRLECNYNTARDRKEGGKPRKPQLRIRNIEYYMRNFGYISPCKYGKIKAQYQMVYGSATEIDGSSLLSGLKYLSR